MTALDNVRAWSAALGSSQLNINGVEFCKRDLDEVLDELEQLRKLRVAVSRIALEWEKGAGDDMLAVIWPESGANVLREALKAVRQ